MEYSNIDKKNSYTLYDYYIIFVKYRKIILTITSVICFISIILYFFVIPPLFLSSSTVKSTAKSGSLAGMLSATGLSGLGDVSDLAGGGAGVAELALYENILNSRECIEETIIKFNLMDEYKEKYMQDAVKSFRENIMEIGKDKNAGTMTIGIYDESPHKAKEIVDFLVSKLNQKNVELNVQAARNNREFLESRYKQVRSDLKKAEDSLKIYQDQYGIAPDIIVKAAVQTQLQVEANIKAEEVKLELLRKVLSPGQDEIVMQEEKIKSMRKSIEEMNDSANPETMLKIKGSPTIVLNYLRLTRDVEVQNKILMFILPLYEQAKVDEKKETPSVLVLDPSFVPERKAKPKRMTMVAVITFSGFLISFLAFFVKDKIQSLINKA